MRFEFCLLALVAAATGCGGTSATTTTGGGGTGSTPSVAVTRILFVGDSYTHGRYQPVRGYGSGGAAVAGKGSALAIDENYGQTGARAESSTETGPWGGIPGMFAEFSVEAGLGPGGSGWEVHIEAISATSLGKNYAVAPGVIAQSQWDAVVLQELSTRPISKTFTGDLTSNPSNFCASVQTIEQAVHGVAPAAKLYLYETWPRADLAQALAGTTTAPGFAASYATNLAAIGNAYHNAYYAAAADDGKIAAVAPAGEAWTRAWAEGVANANPYASSTLPALVYGLNAVNDPAISLSDYAHPGIAGAYLSALVLFQQITGTDARTLGSAEKVAAAVGISGALAVQLQKVAWETVTNESATLVNQPIDPCLLTS